MAKARQYALNCGVGILDDEIDRCGAGCWRRTLTENAEPMSSNLEMVCRRTSDDRRQVWGSEQTR